MLERFYTDNYLDSFPGLEEASKVIVEVIQLLKLGKLNLTKFVSNNSGIDKYTRQQLPKAKDLANLDLDETPIERALGVLWDPKQDVPIDIPRYTVNKEVPNTKRGILKFCQFNIEHVRNFISTTDRTKANYSRSMEAKYWVGKYFDKNGKVLWKS